MHRLLSTSHRLALHAGMPHNQCQTTTSLYRDHELEAEHHHPSQEAEQTLLRTHGSKWLLRSHLLGHKLILNSKALFPDRLEVMRTLQYYL